MNRLPQLPGLKWATILCLSLIALSDVKAGFQAGAAEHDISPPPGMEILHYFRNNIGIHDPLYLRALVLKDAEGKTFALLTADLICAGFAASDQLRERVKAETRVQEVWLNCSHNHSSRWLCSNRSVGDPWTEALQWDEYRDRPIQESPHEAKWNQSVHDLAVQLTAQALNQLEPVTLEVGREPIQVGFNRRLQNEQGETYMGVNREGAVIPWVNVLTARSKASKEPIAILFEHPAHPVTVPHTSRLVSADFPGAAVTRIKQQLGNNVVALFGQGCCGNINSYPLRSTHEDAESAGHRLGDAVIKAVEQSHALETFTLRSGHQRITLPTRELPSLEVTKALIAQNQDQPERLRQLNKIVAHHQNGTVPKPRRFDVYGLFIGDEWGLIGMSYEMFAEYELWIDRNAPFERTMTLSLTNGGRAYIGTDQALARGPKGGYEAGCLPNWGGHETMSPYLAPPAVGTEKLIRKAFQSTWASNAQP